jgi:hypothetical protein
LDCFLTELAVFQRYPPPTTGPDMQKEIRPTSHKNVQATTASCLRPSFLAYLLALLACFLGFLAASCSLARACLLACWLPGWLTPLSTLLTCWAAGLRACSLAGLLACWLAGLLACWLAHLLACLPTCLLFGPLAVGVHVADCVPTSLRIDVARKVGACLFEPLHVFALTC